MKLSAIILNYNGLKNTLNCLESIKNSAFSNQIDVVVVDNNSGDGSQKKLSEIKNITYIENDNNLGFSGGMNVGIKHALKNKADYILILNNDIFLDRLFFNKLLQNLNKNEIIAPKIYFAKGFEFHKQRYKPNELGKVIWYAGGKIDWSNVIGLHIGVDDFDRGQFSKGEEIDFATGACMLIPNEVFNKIGFFDEKYFLYLEDMDFCVRAKKAGFKIIFKPQAVVWHKNAASAGGSGSKLQDYYISRNRLLFAFKYAKFNTKLAVIKQTLFQIKNPVKRQALLDFLFMNFGKGSFKT